MKAFSSKTEPQDSVRQDLDQKEVQPLTPKEKSVLDFLESFVRLNGFAPSYQEICQHFRLASINSAQRYLKQLEAKSYVALGGANQKRAIRLLQSSAAYQNQIDQRERNLSFTQFAPAASSHRSLSTHNNLPLESNSNRPHTFEPPTAAGFAVPLLGAVAAGHPLEAYAHDESIEVPRSLVRDPAKTYALRVQGQSMIEDGIFDGDFILVERQNRAENGEIVVAVVESSRGNGEEATVKRFYRSTDRGKAGQIELRPANSAMKPMWFQPGEVQIRGVVVGLIRKF